jgi:hypothetical protein
MRKSHLAASAAIFVASLMASGPAGASPNGIKIGVLTCHVHSGWGYVLGSSRGMDCEYRPERGDDDRYVGRMSKFGVDVGYTSAATIIWNVIAPTSDVRAGALEGSYAGATASATVGAGIGAHVLFGGFHHSIALQPVSFEGSTGLDVAAGVGAMSLDSISPPEPMPAAYVVTEAAPIGDAAPPPVKRVVIHRRIVHHHRRPHCGCQY